MNRICLDCNHACHCIGQGYMVQDTNCYFEGCVCTECMHTISVKETTINREDNMIKKTIKWVRKIVCWPWKKLVDWLWTR